MPYPATLEVDTPEKIDNWRPLVQWILAIPHLIIVEVFEAVAFAVAVISWFSIVFTGKVGFNTVFFKENIGSKGRSHGFGWAAQIALELNFINERRANALDEDWGINSSFFFFELAGSDANSRAPVGDKFYFTGGVGLTF